MTKAEPNLLPAPKRIPLLMAELQALYPETRTALDYKSTLQLAVATILSAQCTDERVNKVTPALFKRYHTAQDYADSEVEELEGFVKTTGFFRNKAKNIRALCRELVDHHGGNVPGDLETLVKLPGIGRKTANVILGDAFGVPGIPVDTHVGRLSRRLGLTTHKDPVKVEHDLMELVPREEWTRFSHRLIYLGRQVCFARKPNCGECKLAPLCPRIGVEEKTEKPEKKKSTTIAKAVTRPKPTRTVKTKQVRKKGSAD